jgi:hypothetical protein
MYLSPNVQILFKIVNLCRYYEIPIILTENLYSLLSLKARNTLRKIDVIMVKECKEPLGLFTFDITYNDEVGNNYPLPEGHEFG